MIPEWMKEVEVGPCPCCSVSLKKKNYVAKTLNDILKFIEETIVSEGFARQKGLLQSLDPRVKLVSIIVLIVAISMTSDWRILLFVYVLTLLFAYLSKIGILFFIKRVWLFIPIFSGIIMLPMMFNVFFPGTSLITLVTLGHGAMLGPFHLPDTIAITVQGTRNAIVFTLRVATCVSAAVLLFVTTRRDLLFKSLRSVGVPKVYVFTIDMCYRYIFVFTDLITAFYTSKKSRSIRALPLIEEEKWVGGRIGYTLIKSMDIGEKVHGAMVSRGFNGDIKIMDDFHAKRRDYVALVSVLAFSLILILLSHQIIGV
jgi:cobalt/nickel transport system permease protein